MLDHHHGVAAVAQPVQYLQQQLDIVEMQAGGGLVQNIQGAPGIALAIIPEIASPAAPRRRTAWWRSAPG